MNILGTCILVIGLATLVIAGFLSVVRELVSKSVFSLPSPATEKHVVEPTDDVGFPEPDEKTS